MATLIIDTVRDAQLEYSDGGFDRRRVRTGIVKDIALPSGTPDPDILDAVLSTPGVPAMMSADPSDSDRLLTTVRVEPVAANMVRLFWVYETPGPNTSVSIYIIRDESYDSEEETNLLAENSQVIKCSWTGGTPSRTVPEDSVILRMPFSMRAVTMTKTHFGEPPSSVRNAHNTVNDDTWLGYPVGYWRVNRLISETAKYSGYYTYTVAALSRVNRDWSFYGTLQDEFGKFVPVTDADMAAATAGDYDFGVFPFNGIVRVGKFAKLDFATLFGFS